MESKAEDVPVPLPLVDDEVESGNVKRRRRWRRLLHEFFVFEEYPQKVATVYDDGKDVAKCLTYFELHGLARMLSERISDSASSEWCIGCSLEQNHVFPAFQIGLVRNTRFTMTLLLKMMV
jgi:hypothetical protein